MLTSGGCVSRNSVSELEAGSLTPAAASAPAGSQRLTGCPGTGSDTVTSQVSQLELLQPLEGWTDSTLALPPETEKEAGVNAKDGAVAPASRASTIMLLVCVRSVTSDRQAEPATAAGDPQMGTLDDAAPGSPKPSTVLPLLDAGRPSVMVGEAVSARQAGRALLLLLLLLLAVVLGSEMGRCSGCSHCATVDHARVRRPACVLSPPPPQSATTRTSCCEVAKPVMAPAVPQDASSSSS